MNIFRKQIVGFIILFSLTAFFAAYPLLHIIQTAGSDWKGIVPNYVTDSFFYLARMVKGVELAPFGNNPWFLEHTNDISPAISIADYIGALPLKLGFSLPASLILNAIVWNIIFVYLLYLFLKQLGAKNNWAFLLVIPVYLSVYGMMVRPVVLEVVLPFLIFFLWALIKWLKEANKLNNSLVVIGLAGTFYIYPYTWQIAVSILGIYFLWFLKNKEWGKAKLLFLISLASGVVALPALVNIYEVFTNPLFGELISRSGSIPTHLPAIESFNTARWIIAVIVLLYAIWRFVPELRHDKNFRFCSSFLLISGLGFFGLLMSPIITGRDAVIGNHVGRELFLWLALSVSLLVYFLIQVKYFWSKSSYKKFIIIGLLVVNIFPLVKQYERSLRQPFQASSEEIISMQDYSAPVSWLDTQEEEPQVVWANGLLGDQVLISSKHFLLFPRHDLSNQYFMRVDEIQERYLVSKYFYEVRMGLSEHEFTMALGHYDFFARKDLNWKADVCENLKLAKLRFCDISFDYLDQQKERQIGLLIEKNKKEIRPHIYQLLKKYQVSYAIKDLEKDQGFDVQKLKGSKEIYNDGRFIIYKLTL